jgi:His-Xaa-Ser repeat protein HxsA
MTTAPLQAAVAALPQPTLTLDEKRRLQIMRVQIRLTTLGLFTGQMNGTLDDKTKQSLKLFQKVKGLPETGLMTTPTLNALGVPAVN